MPDAITDAELAEWEGLSSEATAGPWFFNGYSGVFSEPLSREYDRAEREIDDDAPEEAYAALPETTVAKVPVVAGDTATGQGAKDAAFIAAAREALPRLIGEVRRLRGERAPVAKVTERVGCLEWGRDDVEANVADMPLWALIPDEAKGRGAGPYWGTRGRFRIAVEFWPEEPPTP